MDAGGHNLVHLQLHVEPLEPRPGVLELLRRLRPHWKPREVHMKVAPRSVRHTCEPPLGFSQ